MLCTVTCFDRVMNLVKELPMEKLREAVEVTTEYSFSDFLDFVLRTNALQRNKHLHYMMEL